MNTQRSMVKVSPQVLSIIAAHAIEAYAQTGRTVGITRWGEAPIVPYQEGEFLIKVADEEEIRKLKRHKEVRARLEILEHARIPYTDIIVAHEIKEPKKPMKERIQEGINVLLKVTGGLGVILGALVNVAAGVIYLTVMTAVYVVSLVFAVFATVDPIVWCRLPSGEWVELCWWDE